MAFDIPCVDSDRSAVMGDDMRMTGLLVQWHIWRVVIEHLMEDGGDGYFVVVLMRKLQSPTIRDVNRAR